jgi:hypothetical protein
VHSECARAANRRECRPARVQLARLRVVVVVRGGVVHFVSE